MKYSGVSQKDETFVELKTTSSHEREKKAHQALIISIFNVKVSTKNCWYINPCPQNYKPWELFKTEVILPQGAFKQEGTLWNYCKTAT